MIGSLRHAQLTVAGAPRKESELVSDIRLRTGTMWHSYFNELLIDRGHTVMHEVKLRKWLPDGWSGTADWLIWDATKRAFVLGDLKTMKGEGLQYVREAPKEEHLWQLSAYWHALVEGRFPMASTCYVLYLPMNDVSGEDIEPIITEFTPLPKGKVWTQMIDRWELTSEYVLKLSETMPQDWKGTPLPEHLLLPELAPPMPRVQKLFKNKDKYELKLVPHWSSMFCPFDDELCDCNTQGFTKIGEWVDGNYSPRKGYDDIAPELRPRLTR